jgi:hypothetical protein
MKFLVFLLAFFVATSLLAASPQRIALVIGNSKYANLGALENTSNDARSIEKSLREMGYKTKIIIDADETSLRKTIRSFASESSNSSIALVFYAGHGAQINGENFLLPIDIDVPRRESDIQLSAIKVDDIVNSLKSRTKVIFLDACRDNPALSKSLTKGRGSFRGGLAAAKSSSYEDAGSLFIAYATDSGNVAQDGDGQKNSPFTAALLKNIKAPISIDDMFSLVTREVRLVTKNTQKPYKYASLEGVICLTERCGSSTRGDSYNQLPDTTISTQDQDFGIAANSDDVQIIYNFIEKYPDYEKNSDLQIKLANLGWGWKKPLLLVDFNIDTRAPMYLVSDSLKAFENRKIFDVKWIFEDSVALSKVDKEYAYHIHSYVIDCVNQKGANYQTKAFDKNDKLLFDNQLGDPKFIKLDIDLSNTAELANSFMNLVCKPELMLPLTSKNDIESDSWERLFSVNQYVDYFKNKNSIKRSGDIVDVLVKYVFKKPKKVSQTSMFDDSKLFVSEAAGYQNVPVIKSILIHDRFDCKKKSFLVVKQRFFDDQNNYVGLQNFTLK